MRVGGREMAREMACTAALPRSLTQDGDSWGSILGVLAVVMLAYVPNIYTTRLCVRSGG